MHTPQLADKLRRALLQAAMEGKLSERQADDGHAQDLLKQIQAEKAAQIQAGRLKKSKGLPEIGEDEKPFTIPENWVWVRLGDLLFQLTDGTHSTPKYVPQGVPFLSVKNISSGTISFEDTKYISETEHLELAKRCKPEKGDILLSKVGTTGIPVLVESDIEFNIFVSLALLKFSNDLLFPKFLVYLILSPIVQQQAKENTRGVGNKNWVLTAIANTVIPLPPLPEQARIVAKLDALLAETDALKAQESALADAQKNFPKMLRASLLQAAVEGKLTERESGDGHVQDLLKQIQAEKAALLKAGRLKKSKGLPEIGEDEKPFTIPENWVWVRLGEIGQIIGGGTPKTTHSEYWNDGSIPWITPADMRSLTSRYIEKGARNITQKGLESSSARLLPKGSVLFSSRAPIGYVAIAKAEMATNQGFKSIVPFQEVMNEYLYYVLLAFKSEIEKLGTGTTFKEVSGAVVGNVAIPLPPLAEQARIVAKLDALLAQIESLENLS